MVFGKQILIELQLELSEYILLHYPELVHSVDKRSLQDSICCVSKQSLNYCRKSYSRGPLQ